MRDDIKSRLSKLGFTSGRISFHPSGIINIQVTSFKTKSSKLVLDKSFRPFTLRAKFFDHKLNLVKEDL